MAFLSKNPRKAVVETNENMLGLIELLSQWDPILNEHVLKVEV